MIGYDDEPAEEEPLARPFLDGAPRSGHLPPVEPGPRAGYSAGYIAGYSDVRPYLMTGGRTGPGELAIAIETVVVASELWRRGRPPGQTFERARILRACSQPRSVAEVAALLEVPLGVAIVLVADLVMGGLLDAAGVLPRQSHDIDFLERLIVGVSAL